ncbi:NUDIX hydrolase [Pelobium sp.]|nr:NUDIX hydrolase [Pelobium sp.]MDA9554620.1 NUDIX hydrolase [Pelobium sp.]
MKKYSGQSHVLLAVDCIVFGFDGQDLKVLLIKRGFEPERDRWSLMGGFVKINEDPDQSAIRVLHELTGLSGVYLEQLRVFGHPNRDPIERTVSISYFALIDIHKYEKQLNDDYHAEWFLMSDIPDLIFDHQIMINQAKKQLRYKAALHPILFELLAEKFTLPQLLNLYENIYETEFDKRNFSRKLLSTGLLIKQKEKQKDSSKKGAYYFSVNKTLYKDKFHSFLNLIPNPENLID